MATKQKTTAREWAARVKRWQRSGLSAPDFGRREGFEGKQLTWWKWHLSRKDQASAAKKPAKRGAKAKSQTRSPRPRRAKRGRTGNPARRRAARFVPVKLPVTVPGSALEIVLGNGRVVRVPSGCDGAWLTQVLAAADGE